MPRREDRKDDRSHRREDKRREDGARLGGRVGSRSPSPPKGQGESARSDRPGRKRAASSPSPVREHVSIDYSPERAGNNDRPQTSSFGKYSGPPGPPVPPPTNKPPRKHAKRSHSKKLNKEPRLRGGGLTKTQICSVPVDRLPIQTGKGWQLLPSKQKGALRAAGEIQIFFV